MHLIPTLASLAFRRAFEAEAEEDEFDRVAVGQPAMGRERERERERRRRSAEAGRAEGDDVGMGAEAEELCPSLPSLLEEVEEKPDGSMEVRRDGFGRVGENTVSVSRYPTMVPKGSEPW